MATVHTSPQFVLKARDFFKGLIMAVGTPLLYFLQEYLPTSELDPVYKIAISAGIAYLLKNFFEPSKIITVTDNGELQDTKERIEKVA